MRRRGAGRDAAKLADWPTYVGTIDLDFRPSVEHVVIENCAAGTPLQVQAKGLLKQIAER